MYAEFSWHRLKICAEKLENCEKKLERSLLELSEWRENLARRKQGLLVGTKDLEEAAELNAQWQELTQAVRHVKLLKTELFHIIRIYHACEEAVQVECKKLHRNSS